jgi:hypothetical protein
MTWIAMSLPAIGARLDGIIAALFVLRGEFERKNTISCFLRSQQQDRCLVKSVTGNAVVFGNPISGRVVGYSVKCLVGQFLEGDFWPATRLAGDGAIGCSCVR